MGHQGPPWGFVHLGGSLWFLRSRSQQNPWKRVGQVVQFTGQRLGGAGLVGAPEARLLQDDGYGPCVEVKELRQCCHTEPGQTCLLNWAVPGDYTLLWTGLELTFLGSESTVLKALLQFSVSTSPVSSFVGRFLGTAATELGL